MCVCVRAHIYPHTHTEEERFVNVCSRALGHIIPKHPNEIRDSLTEFC